jgi:CRISPR type I-E-associated protein CasB/Cse2
MNEKELKQTGRSAVMASAGRIMALLKGNSSAAKAEAARWRHSLGRPMGDDPVLYGEFLLQLDPFIQPRDGRSNPAEDAVWLAVQMYIAGGKNQQEGVSIGRACRMTGDDNIHSRLIIAENAPDLAQLREPLRAVVQLLASRKNQVGMDYAALAGDLYTWHFDSLRVVRRWEQDYAFDR